MLPQFAESSGERKYTLFHVRPYKVIELADIYQIKVRTFQRWLERIKDKIGKVEGHFLTIPQVEVIISHYGVPYFIKAEIIDEDKAEKGKKK
jgi:hypothetical protein